MFGLCDLRGHLAERAGSGFDEHNPEISGANDRSAIVPKQAGDRAMALGPSLATKDDLYEADIALCLGAENARNRVDLAHQRGAMGGELGIAVSEKVLPAASATSATSTMA